MSNGNQNSNTPDYQKVDPFPCIPCALLNSADIDRYMQTTKMVDPYHEEDLKSASYAVRIKGECTYWDEHGIKRTCQLEEESDCFTLQPNSIAFVQIEPTFRLPDYMAVRFNLKISNVYKGLLMGTGPLIDPGFEGPIYVPLHNLTNNPYKFRGKETIVWLEFTKTSPIKDREIVEKEPEIKAKDYVSFDGEKKNLHLDDYIQKASGGKSIVSSIPGTLGRSVKLIDETEKKNKNMRQFNVVSAIGVAITLIGLIVAVFSMVHAYLEEVHMLRSTLNQVSLESIESKKRISELEREIERLRSEDKVPSQEPALDQDQP